MKKVILSLMLTTLTAKAVDQVECVKAGDLYRCENKEVICYRTSSSARSDISCYFKKEENINEKNFNKPINNK